MLRKSDVLRHEDPVSQLLVIPDTVAGRLRWWRTLHVHFGNARDQRISPPTTPVYFIGDQARLSANYLNGTGHIEPGDIPIASGQTVTTPVLTTNTTFHLVVSGGGGQVTQDLALTVSYRERMRSLAMPFARTHHNAVALSDGRVLIVGGVDESRMFARLMYVFDPATETFTPAGSLGSAGPYGSATAALNNGDALLVGGYPVSAGMEAVIIRSGNIIPTTGQPHTLRVLGTATRLEDGKVLVVGGLLATVSGGIAFGISDTPDHSAELYDPATGTFTVLSSSLNVGRYGHTATATTGGRVLIYGGFTQNGEPRCCSELYNHSTGTFTVLTAPEAGVRGNHAAVETPDGDIWIVGGEDPAASALTSVIRFDHTSAALGHACRSRHSAHLGQRGSLTNYPGAGCGRDHVPGFRSGCGSFRARHSRRLRLSCRPARWQQHATPTR